MQQNRLIDVSEQADMPLLKKQGPPNRMNDLNYSVWMKFQKSFFRHSSFEKLVEECVYFFTKAIWPDGSFSRSLIMGFDIDRNIKSPREVDYIEIESVDDCIQKLDQSSGLYDFILINMINLIKTESELTGFLKTYASFFRALSKKMADDRYCGLIVGMPGVGGAGFPIPWSVALAARNEFRLRDEKIALMEENERIYYCVFLQAKTDGRPATIWRPTDTEINSSDKTIPGWIIPRPPPRKKNELLHPAKFPETLIKEFINIFTEPGDTVFDPMAGTGSALLAAVQSKRNAVGIELSQNYVDIMWQRFKDEYPPVLIEDMRPSASWQIIQGDATKLDLIDEVKNAQYNYCVTSPPYWSMLTNKGSEGQENRRRKNLPLVYSESNDDIGNIQNYEVFLDALEKIYNAIAIKLQPGGYLTVIVKNVKRDHVVYPISADLVMRLARKSGCYEYIGNTLWCQDDVKVKPFAVGIHWVSNTLHQYCLHFRKRMD